MRVPSREAIRLLVNKFTETGSILDNKMRVNANFLRRCVDVLMQKDGISNISCDKVRLFFILKIVNVI